MASPAIAAASANRQKQFAYVLVCAWLLSILLLAAAKLDLFSDATDVNDGIAGWLIGCVIAGVVAFAIFFLNRAAIARPEPGRLATRTLVLGSLTAISVAVFWLGLPIVYGAAAIVTGMEAMRFEAAQKLSTYAGLLLGLAGFLAGTLLCLFG